MSFEVSCRRSDALAASALDATTVFVAKENNVTFDPKWQA
jgi:hypothetical protein